ncbi:MAG: hypothetical protein ACOY90_05975 [Candidatus Zhuqueibacterota bacterium]
MKKMLFWLFLILIAVQLGCDNNTKRRKIKLSDGNAGSTTSAQLSTTIRFAEKERRSIAVMFFQNHTGDQNLQWLQKGLTEMLVRALSQSRQLSVLSVDMLHEIYSRLGAGASHENFDLEMAALVGKEANVEAILVGQIKKTATGFQILVQLQEPGQKIILKEESVEGRGLENILTMVDDLSEKIRADLQIALKEADRSKGIAAISTHSVEAWQSFTTGLDLVLKVMNNEAIPYFENAIQLDSSFVLAHIQLASLYLVTGEFGKTMALIHRLQSLRDRATDQDRYQIDLLEANLTNDVHKLITTIETWVNQYPNDRNGFFTLASYYFAWQNYERTIENLEQVIRIDPNYKIAYNLFTYCYAYTGALDNALRSSDTYIKLSPDEANPYDTKGEIYLRFGDYDSAEKYFKIALQKNDNFLHSLEMMGDLSLLRGDDELALEYFNHYLEKSSDRIQRANAYSKLAAAHLKMGHAEKAIDMSKKSLQQQALNQDLIEMIYKQYMDLGDTLQAKESLAFYYANARDRMAIQGTTPQLAAFLAWLSIRWDVNVDESLQLLTGLLPRLNVSPAGEFNAINIKFLLTLLRMKKNQFEEMNQLWDPKQVLPGTHWPILQRLNNFSFTDTWRAIGLLNPAFYNSLKKGEEYYNALIDMSRTNHVLAIEMLYRLMLSDLYLKQGMHESFADQLRIVGMPAETQWMVVGPFPHKNGFHTAYAPEKKFRVDADYAGKTGRIRWMHADDGLNDGYVELNKIYSDYCWSVAYAVIYIKSPSEKQVQFRTSLDDEHKIWLNDEDIWRFHPQQAATFDSYRVNVTLKKGLNKVMVKVCNAINDWGYFFRVTDSAGMGIADIEFVSADAVTQ